MKRFLLVLLVLFSYGSLNASTWNPITLPEPARAEITLQSSDVQHSVIRLQIPGFHLRQVQTDKGRAFVVDIENSSRILKAGAPDLAKLTASVIIPDDGLMSTRIVSSSYTDYENIEIAPSKGNFTRDIDPSSVPYAWGPEYQINRFWPETLSELREPYILRDFRGQTLVVYPFQYNPVTKTLRVYHDLTVEIYQVAANGANPLINTTGKRHITEEFHRVYARHFLNYSPTDYTPVDDFGKLLVISHPDFMNAMQPYVSWKNSIGIPTEMVSTAITGNTTIAIQNYITNYFNTNPDLTFVLLVGDAPQIPTNQGSGLGGPSDNAYGYLLGNDHYIDVFIGRFSAENLSQVETQVTRTINYEKDPQFLTDDWYTTCLGIASDQGPGDDNEYDYQHIRNMQTKLLNYTYTWNPELFDGNQGGNDAPGNPTPAMVATEVNNGTGIILYTGHGSTTSWGTSGFNNANVNQLTNIGKLPFIWSVACVNGEFMNTTCFAEAWLRATQNNQPTGAIAFLGSTINQSWNSPMEGQDEMVDILVETYPNNIKRTFAGLSLNGCAKMIDTYGTDGADMADTWTVFGDPTVWVRTANPQPITANHNPTLFVGSTTFTVYCPVDGARVTLSNNGVILNTTWVANGVATLNFDPILSPDTVRLVIFDYNRIPYIADLAVIPATGPYVIYENSQVADLTIGNGNGQLDYAETTNLTIGIKNIGVAPSENTQVTLRTTSPFVTVVDSTENYDSVPAGQVVAMPEGFQVMVSPQVPDKQVISFKLIVSDTAETWNSLFTLQAHAPVLSQGVVSVVDTNGINNNSIDPGETVFLNVTVSNMGTSGAYNITGTLSSSDPYLIISTPSVFYGDLLPLGIATQPFMVSALPTTPPGYQATLTITYTGDYGYTASFDITVTIGRIPALVIDLDGNTNSGTKMKTALDQLGVISEYTTIFPSNLDKYQSVFVCLGVYPNKHVLTSAEGQVLKSYLMRGGRLYMEGGDTWYYDQLNTPTPVHPLFNIKGLKDNGGILSTINGISTAFTAGMSFTYNGDNNYIDKIEPQNGSYTIFKNASPLYDVTIANDPGTGYKTIGASNEFGGLVDFAAPSTKKQLMWEYLNFFDVFGNPYWANFVALPTSILVGEQVQFYDLSSTVFTNRLWTFPGGYPENSTEANPVVTYNSMGSYDVTLEVSSPDSTMIVSRIGYITVIDVTGVKEDAPSLSLTLYPNPVRHGVARINLNGEGVDISKVSIYNLTGEEVLQVVDYRNNSEISLNSLKPGIYLVKVMTNKGSITRKISIL
ncbi:MAG: T9SS type A sorting domain-containing protein [Bacteroidales bacterium]|nr:T9SS type A sorting domain-containing protein [Bacteroidales bacterium]